MRKTYKQKGISLLTSAKKKIATYSRLELFLLVIGIISLFVLFTSLFTMFGETNHATHINSPVVVGEPLFEETIETISRTSFVPGEDITILNNGDEFFPDLLNEIQNASSSILMTNFIWDDTEIGNELFDAVIAKSTQGVDVRILLDGVGGKSADNTKIEQLRNSGAKVEVFRPTQFGKLTRIHRRTHIRAIVIDNRIGYTGGIAFSDAWLGNGTGAKNWRDMMFKTKGEMTNSIQDIFAKLWNESTGEILVLPDVIATSSSTNSFVHLFHSPAPDLNQDLSSVIWTSIAGAKDHIHIVNPYFLPNDDLISILEQKVDEGVTVEIILPGEYIDTPHVRVAYRSYYKKLLEAGIHVYEYQPGRLHTKMITIDNEWSLIGSANLDSRSDILNIENIMGVQSEKFAQELEAQFEKDKAQSVLITQEDIPSIAGFMLGKLSRIFVKQY